MPFQCTPFFDGSDSWHLSGIEQGRAAKDLPSRGILDKGHWVSKRSIFLDHGIYKSSTWPEKKGLARPSTHFIMPFI